MIAAPDDKVDLRPFEPWVVRDESPTRLLRRNPADAELLLNLAGMEQTDEFKCQALPDDSLLIFDHVKPVLAILAAVVLDKGKVEQREIVDQLVHATLFLLASFRISPYERTSLQILQNVRQGAVVPQGRHKANQFVASETCSLGRKCRHNGDIRFRLFEHGSIQSAEFAPKFGLGSKEQSVHALRKAFSLVQKTPVVWGSTEDHVGGRDVLSVHRIVLFCQILFAFVKSPRLKVDCPIRTVEKPPAVLKDLVHHP